MFIQLYRYLTPEASSIRENFRATVALILHLAFFLALSGKVDNVKEENLKLKSENQVLGQYIENLMSASTVFQNTDAPSSSHPH